MNTANLKLMKFLIVFFTLSMGNTLFSQIEVKGIVTSAEDGLPIPMVHILYENNAGLSDVDGNFTILLNDLNSPIVFSSIGFQNDTVYAKGNFLSVVLQIETTELSEVVITALGVEREKKSIGYALTEIKAEELGNNNDPSVVNRLSGKVAGLKISSTNGGAGASSRIILRGNNSITGNNQALIVVDGVPINNTTTSNAGDEWGGKDFGNGVSDVNPDDIESISVLKGASASALYGSQATNGVILITTKSGSQKKISVAFSSTSTIESPYILYNLQNQYGAGRNGKFEGAWNIVDGVPVFQTGVDFSRGSWGPRLNGQSIIDWDGQERAFLPQPDNYKDFFRNGSILNNSISVSGGKKDWTYRFSVSNNQTTDIVPGASLSRTNIGLKLTAKLSEKISINSYLSFVNNKANNRPALSDSHDNPSRNFIHMPRHISLSSLENTIENNGNEVTWFGFWNWMTNPYWNIANQRNGDNRNRLFGHVSLNYKFSEKLNLMLRTAPDVLQTNFFNIDAQNGLINSLGQYSSNQDNQNLINSDFLLTYNDALSKKIKYSLNLGGNAMYFESTNLTQNTSGGLVEANVYNLENSVNPIFERNFLTQLAKNSLYAFGQIEFNKILFVDLSLRNDWSSTLPEEGNSFLYGSASLGFVYSDLLNRKKISERKFSFGKLRLSYANVGNEGEPYQLETSYQTINNGGFGDSQFISSTVPNLGLLPELLTSFEVGSEMKFFWNRLGIDLTYYNTKSFNQISNISVSAASGYNGAIVNSGTLKNSGIELQLNANPIQKKNFSWDLNIAYAKNKSEILELGQGVQSSILYEHWRLTIEARPNNPYGDIVGFGFLRNENDNILVDASGIPLKDPEPKVLGNFTPDFSLSLQQNFRYKQFKLTTLLHGQFGGDIFAGTNMYGYGYAGNFEGTLEGREEWYASEAAREAAGLQPEEWQATGGFLVEGVYADGSIVNGVDQSGQPNQSFIDPFDYYERVSRWQDEIHEPFIYDASFIKLREINLSYQFKSESLTKSKFSQLSLGLIASNLWLIHSNVPNIDPETSLTNGNGQGYELYSYPNRRSFGFFIKANI